MLSKGQYEVSLDLSSLCDCVIELIGPVAKQRLYTPKRPMQNYFYFLKCARRWCSILSRIIDSDKQSVTVNLRYKM